MDFFEETIETEDIFEGKIIKVKKDKVKLPDGKISYREIVEHNGGVGIVPIINGNEVILIRQFRKPFDEVIIEIPAGKLEKGEDPYECGIRELEEETGFIPVELKPLTVIYPSPGFANEKLYLYMCNEMKQGSINFDEDEMIETFMVKIDEAVEMIKSGEIKDAKTIIGILLAKEFI